VNKVVKVILAAVALSTIGLTANAGDFDKTIKARKAYMQVIGFQMGNLGAMAKGRVPYDAKAARAYADNMLALAKMDTRSLWPKGSDNVANPGMTRAKLKAWSTYPKIKEANDAWAAASMKLAAAAGGGLDSLRGAMSAVGKSCGSCHKPFRAPKSKK